ncbi:MAG: hypothetical protein ACRELF_28070 [Gemmataceae bacterium]
MKGSVNPFEPWRPPQANVPPPLRAAQPWRPPPPRVAVEEPPFVEPVDPPRRNKPPQPPRAKQPQNRPAKSTSGRTPLAQLAAFVVLCVLAILGLDNLNWLRCTHMPRLIALECSAVVLAGMAFNCRRDWHKRLTWMAASLAFAGIAAWFVPTAQGVNLWSAYRQVEVLRSLPVGAVAEYQSGVEARRLVVKEFPSFGPDIRAAERDWLRRTVEDAVERADRRATTDPQQALVDLHRLDDALAKWEHYALVAKELEMAKKRALQACRGE